MAPEEAEQVLALAAASLTRQEWLEQLKTNYPADATPADMALFWEEVTTLLGEAGYPVHQVWSYEQAIADFGQIERSFEVYAFSVNLALCLDRLSGHREAVKRLRQALQLLKRTWAPDWPESLPALQAVTLNNLATAYLNQGKTQLAITHNKKALVLKQALNDQPGQITVLIGLANAHRDQGLYREAETFYQQAMVFATQHGDKPAEVKCALGQGNLHMAFMDYEAAVYWYERAMVMSGGTEVQDDLSTVYVNLGNAYHHLAVRDVEPGGNLPSAGVNLLLSAMDLYKKALASTPADDSMDRADILLKYGHVAVDLGKPAPAEQSYMAAFALIAKSGNYALTFEILIGLGDLALQQRHLEKALKWYQQALSLSQANRHWDHESMAYAHVGYAYVEQGDWASAIPCMEASIELSERLGHNLFLDTRKIGYFSATQTDYEVLIHAYLKIGSPERAFDYVEKSKSKTLLDVLGTGELPVPSEAVPVAVLQQEKRYRQVIRERMLIGVDAPEIAPLLEKMNRLYQQLESLVPEYVSVRRGDVLSFGAVQAWLTR